MKFPEFVLLQEYSLYLSKKMRVIKINTTWDIMHL